MGATPRDKVYESFERKKKKAENRRGYTGSKPGLVKKMAKLDKKNTDYLRIGDRVVRPRTHPGVLSHPTSKRPTTNTKETRIKKATVGFGKDASGKPIGQTTWVKLPHNPTADQIAKGERMARNQRPKPTRPQAKAPKGPSVQEVMKRNAPRAPEYKPFNVAKEVEKHQRLSPHLPGDSHDKVTPFYGWKREENPHLKNQAKSFSAGGVKTALAALGGAALATGAALTLKQQATNTPKPPKAPKRNKSAAVEAAKARKPLTMADIETVKIETPVDRREGEQRQGQRRGQAGPRKKVSELDIESFPPEDRPPAQKNTTRRKRGSDRRVAGVEPKPEPAPKPQAPRSILELERQNAPKAPEAPEAPKAPETPTTRTAPTAPAKKEGFFESIRNAFKDQDALKEERAAEAARGSRVLETTPTDVPVDTSAEVTEAKEQAGKVKRVTKKVTGAGKKAKDKATSTVQRVKQGVKDAVDPNIQETRAARSAIQTPVDPEPEMTPDEAKARKQELTEQIERAERDQGTTKTNKGKKAPRKKAPRKKAPAKKAEAPVEHPTHDLHGEKVEAASPEEVEAAKQRDLARAKARADELRAGIAAAEGEPTNENREQKLETTPDERQPRQGDRRTENRRGPGRMTAREAYETGTQADPAPKRSSRRQRGSDPRITTPDTSAEQDLAKQLEAARTEQRNLTGEPERRKHQTTRPGGKRITDPAMTPAETAGAAASTANNPAKTAAARFGATEAEVEAVASSGEKVTAPTEAQKKANAEALKNAPKDVQDLAKSAEAAERQAEIDFWKGEESPENIQNTAEQTSRSATSKESTKAATGSKEFTPWTEEKWASATPEEMEAYKAELEKAVEGETSADKAKRKKATQRFYKEKKKRIEEKGSFRKGTSSAVDPAVVGAEPKVEPEPTYKERPNVDEQMKKQGIKPTEIPATEAPESDATTEEWEKRRQNAETAKNAARTPLEQAKLDAAELNVVISEAEARKGTLGEKIKEAAGIDPKASELADVDTTTTKRVINSRLNNEGEFETKILEGEELKRTVQEAQEDRRKNPIDADRRQQATRRKFDERSTKAEASELIKGSEREMIGAKKSTRREKKPGGDRRQAGSTWEPPNIAEEVERSILDKGERPGGGPERHGPTVLDLDTGELRDAAQRGDPIAKEILKQQLAERRGREKGRRAEDKAAREVGKLERDIRFAEEGLGKAESTLTWDPKTRHPVANPQMDVNADLMPKTRVYEGDPIKQNTLEKMNRTINQLEKRLKHNPNVMYKGHETLEKMKRQRDGLAQEIEKEVNTRQFPDRQATIAEQARKRGETRIPPVERRGHVKDEEGRRVKQKTPDRRTKGERRGLEVEFETEPTVERRTSPTEVVSGDRRTTPDPKPPEHTDPRRGQRRGQGSARGGPRTRGTHEHRGIEQGTTRPAPDLSTPKPQPRAQAPLTNPAIGAHVGENIWERVKAGVKKGASGRYIRRGAAGAVGFGAVTAGFAAPRTASAYMDAAGEQRDRIRAAGGEALEEGIAVGTGMALFTGGLYGAKKAVPGALAKAGVGLLGHAAGAAAVGWTAGTFGADIYNRVKRVQDKNRRDEAHAKEKYGTVEAATRTRKERNRKITLSEADAIMAQWEKRR